MSISKQQHKLKPQPLEQQKNQQLEQEQLLEQQKVLILHEERREPQPVEALPDPLSYSTLTAEAKLVEQLETCVNALLSLISIGAPESEVKEPSFDGPPVLNSYSKKKVLQSSNPAISLEKPKPLLNKTF